MVCIHGWVHVPAAITGSVDGLLILDSMTGEPLAERIGETPGWREITLYRMAPHSGQLVLTFALSGLGEAWLDDVTVRKVGSDVYPDPSTPRPHDLQSYPQPGTR